MYGNINTGEYSTGKRNKKEQVATE